MNTIVSQEVLGYQRMPDHSVATIVKSRWEDGTTTYVRSENIYYPSGNIDTRIVPIESYQARVDIAASGMNKPQVSV